MESDSLFDMLFEHHTETEKPERMKTERAPFGYIGGKSKSVENLMKHLPYRKKWVDHFSGSGVVTINRKPSPLEVMNDRYGGVVAFYRCLQNREKCDALIQRIALNCNSREEFYHAKMTWCDEKDDVERAAKWYYMMKMSVSYKGQVYGRSTNHSQTLKIDNNLDLFLPVHHRIKDVQIENLDWQNCFADYDCHDCVHYFDPPYVGVDQGAYEHKWTKDDQANLLRHIANAKGFCALSGYADPMTDACSFWTKRIEWQVNATSNGTFALEENHRAHLKDVKYNRAVTEVLWIKE